MTAVIFEEFTACYRQSLKTWFVSTNASFSAFAVLRNLAGIPLRNVPRAELGCQEAISDALHETRVHMFNISS